MTHLFPYGSKEFICDIDYPEFIHLSIVYRFTDRFGRSIYEGETGAANNRFLDHHVIEAAKLHGATHICYTPVNGKQLRKAIEALRLARRMPPLNSEAPPSAQRIQKAELDFHTALADRTSMTKSVNVFENSRPLPPTARNHLRRPTVNVFDLPKLQGRNALASTDTPVKPWLDTD